MELSLLALACGLRGETGSEVCATCHGRLPDAYATTGMARSSGEVRGIEAEGLFAHKASGVRYRVYRKDAAAWFSFDLGDVQGSRRLEYFVGSGTVGRSYLYLVDGFLYQAPVSWYSAPGKWDLSPGYQQYDALILRAVSSRSAWNVMRAACSRRQARRMDIACRRSGRAVSPASAAMATGDAHAAGRGKIVNPGKLTAERRDSICAQCHLSGEARIARAGVEGSYRPGELLSDSLVVFGGRATRI